MRLFKSSSILYSLLCLAIIFTAGCVSSEEPSEQSAIATNSDKPKSAAANLGLVHYFSPNASELKDFAVGDQQKNANQDSNRGETAGQNSSGSKPASGNLKQSLEFRKAYCKNGSQYKPYKMNFTAVIPQIPPGTAIDRAAPLQEDLHGMMVLYAKYFLSYDWEKINADRKIVYECAKTWTPTPKSFSRTDFIEAQMGDSTDIGTNPMYTFLKYGKEFVIGVTKKPEAVALTDEKLDSCLQQWLIPIESTFIRNHFTLLFSAKDLDSLIQSIQPKVDSAMMSENKKSILEKFGESAESDWLVALKNLQNHSNERGESDIENSIRIRDKLWAAYFAYFNELKVAQTENPRIVKIESSLDLGLFCSNARSIYELTTK
jgi:hypothetical protein